jgi:hypothetical protein
MFRWVPITRLIRAASIKSANPISIRGGSNIMSSLRSERLGQERPGLDADVAWQDRTTYAPLMPTWEIDAERISRTAVARASLAREDDAPDPS